MWSGADASYLAAITAAGRKYTWHGTLTDANGSTYNFDAEDIVKGSGQISKMVSSDTSLDIGTVYTSELTIRLYLAVNRYVLFGGTIDLYCDVDVNGATYSVPMGEFIIAACTQEMACISITAYDAMTKLDSVNVVQDLGASTPYAWITYFLSRAGLTLGTTQATIEAMPNGTELLTFTNCNTELTAMSCRDALAYMCMILCANAYVGRDGKVYIQQYSMTADDDIAANERFSSSFSDFTTNYTSVTLGIHATGTTEYYAQPTDDGLNYDLGANPWMQAGSAAERETMCRAILADLNAVSYEPYTVSIPIRPELDPMDVLTFSGNQASTDKGAVTSVVYKLGGAMTIKCSGENPRLAGAKSKTQKSLEALSSTVAKEINQMSVVQNSSSVTCGENTETSILTYNFEVTQEENTTMVDVSVVMTSSATETEVGDVYTLADIVAQLHFYVDGSEVSVYDPRFIVDEGKDTMTFNYSLSGLSVGAHQFDVRLTVDGGSGSIAVGDVHEMLWGYGITFEVYVKGIEVATMPDKTTFYVGESLNYDGIRVNAVYNNGLTDDVTTSCTFYPDEGTVLDEYDIGALEVNVYYDEFSTEMELEVVRIRMLFGTTSTNVLAHVVRYNGDLFMLNDIDNSSAQTLNKVGITIGSDGIPVTGSYESLYTFPAFSPSTSRKCVQIGSKRIATPLEYVMTSGVAQAFHYYDFSDGTGGELSVSFINLATAYAITDITNSYFEHAIEVDGHIVWRETTITDSNGASVVCHAVGRVLGTSLEIRFYAGTLKDNALYGYGVDYHTRYELEHLEEQKYFFTFSNSTKVLTLNELTCDGIAASYRQIWTGETELSYIGFHEYFPNGSKVALGLSWLVDGTYVLGMYVVDIQTGTAEYHYSSDRDSDPMYICMLKRVFEDGQHEGIYDPQLGKYVCCRGTLDSETTTVLYLSDDLIDWTIVSGIDNNLGVVADAAWPYAPLETGVLVGSFKRRNYAYEYLAQLRFSNLE